MLLLGPPTTVPTLLHQHMSNANRHVMHTISPSATQRNPADSYENFKVLLHLCSPTVTRFDPNADVFVSTAGSGFAVLQCGCVGGGGHHVCSRPRLKACSSAAFTHFLPLHVIRRLALLWLFTLSKCRCCFAQTIDLQRDSPPSLNTFLSQLSQKCKCRCELFLYCPVVFVKCT